MTDPEPLEDAYGMDKWAQGYKIVRLADWKRLPEPEGGLSYADAVSLCERLNREARAAA